jgi:ATP-dependent DNA helicase Rep
MSAGLNLAQQEAVNCLHAPCLVLAGAGSGKTRVITHKIARLIQTGTPPDRIAAITFTNKAATEMRERAKALVGKAAGQVLICTFHALGVRMLRQDGEALGLKTAFSILDTGDVLSLMKDAGATTDKVLARQWQWTISRWKNEGLTPETALEQAANEDERVAARVMVLYQERLTAYQSVDFDDLIGLPLKLLVDHPAVREKWQQQLAHVLIDEYQDTNATQYELLRHLMGEPKRARFTAVGDDDQSIYGWRGATLDNLKRLPTDYPDLRLIKLEQNYRSTSAILQAANNVIAANPKIFPKKLWSDLGVGEPVRIVDADNEEHEAERVVARIQSIRAMTSANAALTVEATTSSKTALDWQDFAVLYRANHQARVLEQALRKAQIPYRVSGGTSFFDRAEIRDLCSWLRLWVNNDDDPAFLRAITTPKRGIGHQTLGALGTFASQYKLSLFEALFSPSLGAALPARAVASLHEFGRGVNDLEYRARHTNGAEEALKFLMDWLKDMDYEKHIMESEDSAKLGAARWGNVLDFCQWMAARCGGQIDDAAGVNTMSEVKSLLEVAQTISLLSSLSEREDKQNLVTLSTLHAAKGLEWPHVMLIGGNEGLLPFAQREAAAETIDDDAADAHAADITSAGGRKKSSAASRKPRDAVNQSAAPHLSEAQQQIRLEHLQEERRLMYVAITRAQRSLAVSWVRRRKKGRDTIAAEPSRFIAEMQLNAATAHEDPREKLKALRAEFATKAAAAALITKA